MTPKMLYEIYAHTLSLLRKEYTDSDSNQKPNHQTNYIDFLIEHNANECQRILHTPTKMYPNVLVVCGYTVISNVLLIVTEQFGRPR